MERLDDELLREIAGKLAPEDRDEMAIPSYLHSNPLLRWMAWRRLEVLTHNLERYAGAIERPVSNRTLMDFGCGTGVLFPVAARLFGRVFGVDLVLAGAHLVVERRQFSGVELLSPDQAAATVGNQSLDAILAAEVLEHIHPLDDTLAFFRAKLRADGRLLVTIPTENRVYRFGRWLAGFGEHFHVDNAASIHAKLQASGFRSLRMEKIPLPSPFDIYWFVEYEPV